MKKNRPEKSPLREIFAYIRGLIRPDFSQPTQPVSPKSETFDAPDESKKADRQQLYVIWDALGDGRAVGIFDNEELVKKILALNPHYYRSYACIKGELTHTAIEWMHPELRQTLQDLVKSDCS